MSGDGDERKKQLLCEAYTRPKESLLITLAASNAMDAARDDSYPRNKSERPHAIERALAFMDDDLGESSRSSGLKRALFIHQIRYTCSLRPCLLLRKCRRVGAPRKTHS